MARAGIEFILGAIILALGIWLWTVVGPSFAFLGALVLMGIGGAFVISGFATALDVKSPTSRKL